MHLTSWAAVASLCQDRGYMEVMYLWPNPPSGGKKLTRILNWHFFPVMLIAYLSVVSLYLYLSCCEIDLILAPFNWRKL